MGNVAIHVCSLKIHFHAFFPYNILHELDIWLPFFKFSSKWLTIFRPKLFLKKCKKKQNMFDVCILFGHQSLWKDYFFFTHKLITYISYLRWATNHWFTQSGEYKLMFITKTPDAMIYHNNELFHFFLEHAIYYTNLNQPKIRKKTEPKPNRWKCTVVFSYSTEPWQHKRLLYSHKSKNFTE